MIETEIHDSIAEFVEYQALLFHQSYTHMLERGAAPDISLHFATLMTNAALDAFYYDNVPDDDQALSGIAQRLSPDGNKVGH